MHATGLLFYKVTESDNPLADCGEILFLYSTR